MRYEDIIKVLEPIGITTTQNTLIRYEKQGLIPLADRASKGRPGRFSEYPEHIAEEFYASSRLLSGKYGNGELGLLMGNVPAASPRSVKIARELVMNWDHGEEMKNWPGLKNQLEKEKIRAYNQNDERNYIMANHYISFLAYAWEYERDRARKLIKETEKPV